MEFKPGEVKASLDQVALCKMVLTEAVHELLAEKGNLARDWGETADRED